MNCFCSIIIPLYNKEKHIQTTIASVLAQTLQDFEIIIVNDGSTDGSKNAVETFTDQRIKVFDIENRGVSYARNYGVEQASSDLIVFLDADDVWKQNHLENLRTLFEQFPNCGLYASAYLKKDKEINIPSVFNTIPTIKNWRGIVEDYFEGCYIDSIAWTSAAMVPKIVLNELGGFNINYDMGEDIDLWIRIALKFPVAFSNQVTAIYNLNADNRISNSNTNLKQFIDLDSYEEAAKSNSSLKKYLDLNRFSIAIQYKMVGNREKTKSLINKIDLNNLNSKQRALLKLNRTALKLALHIKSGLHNSGILLSSFR